MSSPVETYAHAIISVLTEVNALSLYTVARFGACRNGLSAVALDVI